MLNEKSTVYFLEARTGCTCCAYENFIEGPYKSEAERNARIDFHRSNRTLSSQFASRGVYYPFDAEMTELPDGRMIVGSHVFDSEGERNDTDLRVYL